MALLSLVTLVVGLAVMSRRYEELSRQMGRARLKRESRWQMHRVHGVEVVKAFSQSAGSYKKYSDAV